MVARKAILAALLLTTAGCSSASSGSVGPMAAAAVPTGGPSAQQLAHGRWLKMPAAPIRLCNPLGVGRARPGGGRARMAALPPGRSDVQPEDQQLGGYRHSSETLGAFQALQIGRAHART